MFPGSAMQCYMLQLLLKLHQRVLHINLCKPNNVRWKFFGCDCVLCILVLLTLKLKPKIHRCIHKFFK